MQFIQLVEFESSHPAGAVREALDEWLAISRGKQTLQMSLVAADHDRPNRYWQLLMFPSEQDAAESARMPETEAAFEKWSDLLDSEPVFHNLDTLANLGGPTAPPVDWRAARTPGTG